MVPVNGVTIEAFGATRAVLFSGNYYLYDAAGIGPTLKYAGSVVNAANYSTWSVIGAEQVSSGGYDVVWKNSANAHYSVWSTDSSGNFLTTLAAAPEVLGTDPSLKALEPTLHQDLNGDSTIGAAPPATVGLGSSGDGFAFNFTEGGSLSTAPPEVPDSMPAPADVPTASEPWTQLAGSHETATVDMAAEFFHNLHGLGFLLG